MSDSEPDPEVVAVIDGPKNKLTAEEFNELKSNYEYLSEFFSLKSARKGEKGQFNLTFDCTKCSKSPKSSSKSLTYNLRSHVKNCHNGILSKFDKVSM